MSPVIRHSHLARRCGTSVPRVPVDTTKTWKYIHLMKKEKKCGTAGHWTRVAYLNMSDSSFVCPIVEYRSLSTDQLLRVGYKKLNPDPKYFSITSSLTYSYFEFCGQVAGYQKGSAIGCTYGQTSIDGIYADGVSITRGSPRQHVCLRNWTTRKFLPSRSGHGEPRYIHLSLWCH